MLATVRSARACRRCPLHLACRWWYRQDPARYRVDEDRVAFDEVLAEADVISLHCPLTDDTRKLFDARTMARMKPGSS